jgi:hypothetical protein
MMNHKTASLLKPLVFSTKVVLLVLLFNVQVHAQCNDGTVQAERDLWTTHDCWWDFVLWQYQAYRMGRSDWENWGYDDACNPALPYPKAVNASYLLTYGLNEDQSFQWHGTIDYRRAGEAWSSSNHDQMHYVPSTSRAWLAQAQNRSPEEDRTRMGCLLFDTDSGNGNPSARAGDYVHEGWHHWQYKRGYSGHMQGPVGSCTLTSKGCDWYYWHGVGAYAFGEMHKYTSDGSFFHSPTQAQVEFLCDISESSQSFVPTSVRTLARAEANQRLANRFRNAVAYRCGDPRPW